MLLGKNGVALPETKDNSDIKYDCPLNRQHNTASTGTFQEHINSAGILSIDNYKLSTVHVLVIKADIQSSTLFNKEAK